jgi:DHA3 family macrolide efflux protein-like MFS transporter
MTTITVSMRRFLVFWLGEFVSLSGSAVSGFALLIYVYTLNDNPLVIGGLLALPIVPFMAFSPFAGPLVDRWGTKPCLIISNVVNLVNVSTIAVVLYTHTFHVWMVYLYVCLASFIKALQLNAFEAAVPLLVPKSQLGRANGLRMLMTGVGAIIAPVIAGALLVVVSIAGIVVLDALSFIFALVTLAFIQIKSHGRQPAEGSGEAESAPQSLLADFWEAARYVTARPGLVGLMMLLGVTSLAVGFAELLIRLMVLAIDSPATLGVVFSFGAVGMVATSVVLTVTNWPRRQVHAALVASGVLAASVIAGGLRPNVPLMTASAFMFFAATTVIIRTIQTTWNLKVDTYLLGRAAAFKNMVIVVPQAVANISGGALAYVLIPWVGVHQVRSPFIADLVGHGAGRGSALLLSAVGVLCAILVGVVALNPHLRHLEDELPDALPDTATQPSDTVTA